MDTCLLLWHSLTLDSFPKRVKISLISVRSMSLVFYTLYTSCILSFMTHAQISIPSTVYTQSSRNADSASAVSPYAIFVLCTVIIQYSPTNAIFGQRGFFQDPKCALCGDQVYNYIAFSWALLHVLLKSLESKYQSGHGRNES